MGLSSARALSRASSPHGYQSTGLSLCCNRYGLVSCAKRFVMISLSLPRSVFAADFLERITSARLRRALASCTCRLCATSGPEWVGKTYKKCRTYRERQSIMLGCPSLGRGNRRQKSSSSHLPTPIWPCTKITSYYKIGGFVQNRTTLALVSYPYLWCKAA